MTIVRDQIRYLVLKKDAVIIVMIVTPRRFSAEVLRRGLRTLITSNVIWIKIRLPLFVVTVRKPLSVRSVAVPRCLLTLPQRL